MRGDDKEVCLNLIRIVVGRRIVEVVGMVGEMDFFFSRESVRCWFVNFYWYGDGVCGKEKVKLKMRKRLYCFLFM